MLYNKNVGKAIQLCRRRKREFMKEGMAMRHLGTKELETPRLLLRRFSVEDAALMFQNWASDDAVTKYLRWPSHKNVEISPQILQSWVGNYERPDYYHWAIVFKPVAQTIGTVAVNACDDTVKMAHIGYCIGKAWWGQGIMTEAFRCVMDYLFDEVGMNRIEARHDPRNPASGADMHKCGMRYEGTRRQADWNNQGICDACCYAVLASDR